MNLDNRFGAILKFFLKWRGPVWYRDYIKHLRYTQGLSVDKPVDVMFVMVDHFEPFLDHNNRDEAVALNTMTDWCENYTQIASQFVDSDGVHPQHSWFYPFDAANFKLLNSLGSYVLDGYGEVEFHLHHGHDTSETFTQKISDGVNWFNSCGAMVSAEVNPQQRFAYIAGNWALDNGRGDPQFSGVNNEIEILGQQGCYADFTFPARSETSQPAKVNSIYYVEDDPNKPKSYDTGVDVRVNGQESGDLMLVQGPMHVDWKQGFFETAGFEVFEIYEPKRIDYWKQAHIHVKNRPEWIFIKLHTHGIQSADVFKNGNFYNLCKDLDAIFTNSEQYRLHYVTTREAYNIIKAAECGKSGNPNQYRDFLIKQPANRLLHVNTAYRLTSFSPERISLQIETPQEGTEVVVNNTARLRIRGDYISSLNLSFDDGLISDYEIDGQNCRYFENDKEKLFYEQADRA